METSPRRRRKPSAGEAFSFPSTTDDIEVDVDAFEFESCLTPDSPATTAAVATDELFFNGRLLPHSFPLRHYSTSSSLLSSRSSSAGSDGRRPPPPPPPPPLLRRQKPAVSARVYGSSRRWQFMSAVPAAPALSRDASRRRSPNNKKEKKKAAKRQRRRSWRIGRRILRWLVSACKECHAIEPRRRKL